MDTSWKDACDKYDADVKAGVITFDSEGFADNYPGKAESDASLDAFYASKVDAL